jgi:FkbM family methyltransferase
MHGCSSNYYVDVGCNHPIKYSNTYLLYQMGWRGLCLDANEYLVRQFRRVRPKDRVDWVCVGGKAGEITFSISRDPALSHVVGNTLVNSRASDEDRRIVIAVKTLQQLFEENNVPAQFGLLSIDLEGHDFIALKSFDIRRWRPYLIVIEIHGLDLEICAENEIVAYLRNAGYKIVCFDANNAIFQNMDAANNC